MRTGEHQGKTGEMRRMMDHRGAAAAIGLHETIQGQLIEDALDGDPADLELPFQVDAGGKPVPRLERPSGDPFPQLVLDVTMLGIFTYKFICHDLIHPDF